MPDPALRIDIARYTLSSAISTCARPPSSSAQCSSPHMIFWEMSSSREGMSSGRIPIFIEYSASRAERFAERTAANVASAKTSVPPAVASDAIVVQSTTATSLPAPCPPMRTTLDASWKPREPSLRWPR